MYDFTAPNFLLEIEGQTIRSDVTQFIQQVEYESSESMIDMARITLTDAGRVISGSKVFAPGNEMDIYMGYGDVGLHLIGRVVLMAPKVLFPLDGMPTVEVAGFTRDYLMREQKPNPGEKKRIARLEQLKAAAKGNKKKRLAAVLKKLKQPVVYKDTSVREVVEDRAMGHGLSLDVDDAPWPKGGIIHPVKMSDFRLIQSLSNIVGFPWWVDYGFDKGWELHFKDPTKDMGVQEVEHLFRWSPDFESNLLTFEPEMIFKDHFVEIVARGTVMVKGVPVEKEVTVVEEGEQEASLEYEGHIDQIEGPIESAEAVKLYIGDYAFEVIPKIEFHSEGALEFWVEQWFRRMRDYFIVGNGEVLGIPDLKARQVHKLDGMGNPYDGKWYFGKVRHTASTDTGYRCIFSARRVRETF